MDLKIDTTMASTILSIIVSILSTIAFNNWQGKKEERKRLDDEFNDILKIALEYPYLENIHFASEWTSQYDRNDEKALRYEVYCTLVFNFLEKFSKFYSFDEDKIAKEIAVKDWVRLHRKYWRDPTIPNENVDTYDKRFVQLVENYLLGVK